MCMYLLPIVTPCGPWRWLVWSHNEIVLMVTRFSSVDLSKLNSWPHMYSTTRQFQQPGKWECSSFMVPKVPTCLHYGQVVSIVCALKMYGMSTIYYYR